MLHNHHENETRLSGLISHNTIIRIFYCHALPTLPTNQLYQLYRSFL
jgi:hypothetical protein